MDENLAHIEKLREFAAKPITELKEVAPQPEPVATEKATNPIAQGTISDKDAFDTGNHTNNTSLFGSPASPQGAQGAQPLSGRAQLGTFINGKKGTDFFDFAVVAIVIWVCRNIGYSVKKETLKLTKEEKEMVNPAMQAVLDSIKIDFSNPYIFFAFSIAMTYGLKFMADPPKFTKVVEAEDEDTNEPIVKVTPDNFKQIFELECEKLINNLQKKKKYSRQRSIDWLTKNKQFDKLRTELKLKHNIK